MSSPNSNSKRKPSQPQQQPRKKQIAGITQLVKQIGRGSYGRVFLGQMIQPPNLYFVVKCISIRYAEKSQLLDMQQSLKLIQLIQSPYIVKLYYFLRTDVKLYLYLDYCDSGSLEDYLTFKNGPLSETQTVPISTIKLIIFRQLIEGYRELYRRHLIHSDLKMENILLHQGKVKISGVAFNSIIDHVDFANVRLTTILSIYGSPQLHRKRLGEKHTNKCDIWSLGVVIFQLLYRRPPIDPKLYRTMVENESQSEEFLIDFSKPQHRSHAIEDLLRRMLLYHEEDRISWDELYNHPVFNQTPCRLSSIPSMYSQTVSRFCQYMKQNAIRGYFRIDINDTNQVQLDTMVDIIELSERHDRFVEIFNCMMRDRNESFFYCSMIWVFYRFYMKMPADLNKNREFEFVVINKAYREARKNQYRYFGKERPECAINNDIWQLYKVSYQYQQVRRIFKQDMCIMESLIHAISGITQNASKRINEISRLHNQDIETEDFFRIYSKIISESIVFLRKMENIEDPCRLLLEYMEISFFPNHTFDNNKFDFYKFYELMEARFDLSREVMFNQSIGDYETGIKNIDRQVGRGLLQMSGQSASQLGSQSRIRSTLDFIPVPSVVGQPIVTEVRTTERMMSPIVEKYNLPARVPSGLQGHYTIPPYQARIPSPQDLLNRTPIPPPRPT